MEQIDLDGGVAGEGLTRRGVSRPLPEDVARQVSWLAHLLDERIVARGVGSGVTEFAASFLGAAPSECQVTTHDLSGLSRQLVALELAGELERHRPAALVGADDGDPPTFEMVELGEVSVRVPHRVVAGFPPGTLAPCPLVVAMTEDWHGDTTLAVHSHCADTDAARAFLGGLLGRARADNPFRGKMLEATYRPGFGLALQVLALATVTRDDVVLPPRIWEEVDRNVHGLFAAVDRLAAAGLPANRGLLLAGLPGTGKTLLCRALAGEVPPGVTVVFCDAAAVANSVRTLYRELGDLAPALVVMEDLDLVVADRRRHGASKALVDFLLALDGATSRHQGVATVATTNDARAIDAAAKRAARFDRLIEIPPPDSAGRAAVLTRYLRGLKADVDVDAVAAATEGATGADLRELVTLAVLHLARMVDGGSGRVTTDLLIRLFRSGGDHATAGQYL